jgi:TRAP-type transport system small permease protein
MAAGRHTLNVVSRMTRLCDITARLIDGVLIVGGGFVCLFVFVNVLARYLLNIDLAWVNEIGETIFVWLTFLGAARAVRSHAHLAVLEFVEHLPRVASVALFAALSSGTAGILLLLAVYGSSLAIENMSQTMSVTRLPVGLVYWAAPAGAVLALLFVLEHILARVDFAMAGAASRLDPQAETPA